MRVSEVRATRELARRSLEPWDLTFDRGTGITAPSSPILCCLACLASLRSASLPLNLILPLVDMRSASQHPLKLELHFNSIRWSLSQPTVDVPREYQATGDQLIRNACLGSLGMDLSTSKRAPSPSSPLTRSGRASDLCRGSGDQWHRCLQQQGAGDAGEEEETGAEKQVDQRR